MRPESGYYMPTELDDSEAGCWYLTPYIRYVTRDGEKVLQQLWRHTIVAGERWRDVPVVEEPVS